MEKTSVDTNDAEDMDSAALDKECNALSALFQQIINEMKVGLPNFEEFVTKAGKLHTNLKTTIVVLGSFLDTFQKIADAASNTKGTTRDIGTCLTRIVIRHRAMESRMKTLSGALMDCLVLPIQTRVEEWKKITNVLDKEHHKEYKKSRVNIKKKSEQVVRLKKKTTTHGSISRKSERLNNGSLITDPSVQRLMENCSRDLSHQIRSLHEHERKAVKRVMTEKRARYCTVVQCLNPIINEEFGMLSEVCQIEDVMHKLMNITSTPGVLPKSDEEVIDNVQAYQLESNGSLSLVSPMTTPSPSLLGSRKNSMTSISSLASSTSTLGDSSRIGPLSSKTSSICGSFSDGSPFKQQNSLNGDINYCNAKVTTHHNEQHMLQNGNFNLSMMPSHDSVDFHSLQFQIDDRMQRTDRPTSAALRPGSSQSFTVSTNRHSTDKAEQFIHGKPLCTEQSQGQQYGTLRPHTISNATFENKNRPFLDKNTFVPPDNKSNNINYGHQRSIHSVSQEIEGEQQKVKQSSNSSRQIKSDPFQKIEDERRYSTIRRSCRSSPFRQLNENNSGTTMTSESNNVPKPCAKRPPLPNRCVSAERTSITSLPSNPVHNQSKANPKPQVDCQNIQTPSHFQRCSSLDRSPSSIKSSQSENTPNIDTTKQIIHVKYPATIAPKTPNHYAVPKRPELLQKPSVPNFHTEKQDMVIPQPVYMNSQQLFSQAPTQENEKTSSTNGCNSNNQGNTNTSSLQKCSLVSNCTITSDENASIINVQPSVNSISTSSNNHDLSTQNTEASNEDDDDDIKTPTVEELSFPGTIDGQHKAISINGCTIGCEDISCASSSSSAGSIGSFSSGYGSQSTVVAKGEVSNFDVKVSLSPKSPAIISPKDSSQAQSKYHGASIIPTTQVNIASNKNNETTKDLKNHTMVKNGVPTSIYRQPGSSLEGTSGVTFNHSNSVPNGNDVKKVSKGAFYDNLSYSTETDEKSNPNTKPAPAPPIRRSSSISSQDTNANITNIYRTIPNKGQNVILDDDGEELTPHGSVENLFTSKQDNIDSLTNNESTAARCYHVDNKVQSRISNAGEKSNLNQSNTPINVCIQPIAQLRRSTSMSCSSPGNGISTKTVTFTLPVTESSPAHCGATKTRHIIPVNKESGSLNNLGQTINFKSSNARKIQEKLSPEGEMYGFGEKFRENRKMYFNESASNSFNNNNSPSRHQFQHSTFGSTASRQIERLQTINKDVANFSTPEVVLQNQSFLDALSAKLSVGGNPNPQQQVSSIKVKVPIPNATSKWNSSQNSATLSNNSLPTVERSPSFGISTLDNGKTSFNMTNTKHTSIPSINDNVKIIPHSNKSTIHTEIERGTFNLRKTNGILHDKSAPRL